MDDDETAVATVFARTPRLGRRCTTRFLRRQERHLRMPANMSRRATRSQQLGLDPDLMARWAAFRQVLTERRVDVPPPDQKPTANRWGWRRRPLGPTAT
jgi:hypothetical protein